MTTPKKDETSSLTETIAELKSALIKSEEKFRVIADCAPVGIFLDNAEGKAIYINKKCAEFIGVPPENALDFNWIPYLHPDDRELMVSEWEKAYKSRSEFRLEYRWVHDDGKIVWTLGEVVPLFDDNGNMIFYIGTLTDITARKDAEFEKEKLQAELLQSQKTESIGRLAGGIAHDYNNMLNAIICYTELAMLDIGTGNAAYSKLREVLKAAQRSADITRQLLNFARKQVISPINLEINSAIEDILNMVKRLLGEGINLNWTPHTENLWVKIDTAQLDQMIVNLCLNARDAIGTNGTIDIQTCIVPGNKKDDTENLVLLSVKDSGSGIPKEILENIFEPFFTTKTQGKGTGLGLASVQGIVKQNNGLIEVKSELGKGTEFKIYLPLISEPAQIIKVENQKPATVCSGETILVVEDEPATLEIVRFILNRNGYKILSAQNGQEALRLADEFKNEIALLISDIIMPEISGVSLADTMKIKMPNLKFLFMSGYSADLLNDFNFSENKFHFIQKPFSIDELNAKVCSILKNY